MHDLVVNSAMHEDAAVDACVVERTTSQKDVCASFLSESNLPERNAEANYITPTRSGC